jgi:hypothetical protein
VRAEPAVVDDWPHPPDYCPRHISIYLSSWEELEARAEGHGSPRLVALGAQPTKGVHADPLRWADLVADLEKAHSRLRFGGVHWTVIDYRKRGYTLGQIARALRVRKQTIVDGHNEACERMARSLGWEG